MTPTGFLRTHLESAFAEEAHCFHFPYMFILGGFGKTGGEHGGLPNAILWLLSLPFNPGLCSLILVHYFGSGFRSMIPMA